MAIEFRKVVEGVGPAEFARMKQAHENVPHVGAMVGLVKQGIPPMSDRLL
jgi:hypothetical protein